MASKSEPRFRGPLRLRPPRSQSESIQTVYSRLKKGSLVYPTTSPRGSSMGRQEGVFF